MLKEYLKSLLFAIMIIGGVTAFGIGLGTAAVYYKCVSYSEVTGLKTKVVAPYCFVKVDDTWFSLDELRHDR